MIRVEVAPRRCRLTVTGHACSGAFGQDLVCAGVSAVAVTLAEAVTALEQAGKVTAVTARLVPGQAEIACRPRLGQRRVTEAVFAAAALGLRRLEREYPDYVNLETL